MKRVALLGSTGSIGRQTLDLARRMPDLLNISALAARSNARLLAEQAMEFGARAVGLVDETSRPDLEDALPRHIEDLYGEDSLEWLATRDDVDVVVVAVAGAIGTRATMAALCAGKDVALATKEVLVSAGEVVMAAARKGRARLLPVDSEHSGLMQCLLGHDRANVDKLWLTASGGPFREWSKKRLETATIQDALNHPTWRMGNKITVDSATLMNKGLEMIEAKWLFDMPAEKIDCVVHPQSIVHSLVQFLDGSVVSQMALADMRLPIEYALMYPDRIDCGLPKLSIPQMGTLTFEPADEERFECLTLAREAMTAGGTIPSVLNAANEAAVDRFLGGSLPFMGIPKAIRAAIRAHKSKDEPSLDQILMADTWARRFVYEWNG